MRQRSTSEGYQKRSVSENLISRTSSKTLTLTVSPATIFIPGGSTTPTTQPQVTGVNIGVANITASAPGYTPASQAVSVPATISFSPANLTITGPGGTTKLLIALSDSAPWGPESNPWGNGLTIHLSSSDPDVVEFPPPSICTPTAAHLPPLSW